MEIDLVELKMVVDRLFEHVIETRGVKVLRIEGTIIGTFRTMACTA